MNRAIYCPSNEQLDEARAIAAEMFLPILVGDNETTKHLDFDRLSVGVISIPEFKSFRFSNDLIMVGFRQQFLYENDYIPIRNVTLLRVNDVVIKPMFQENHKIKWSYTTQHIGTNVAELFVNNELSERLEFDVY